MLYGILYVTGSPGIGKICVRLLSSVPASCQGKTVLFDRKGVWYRFSDEGVKLGEFSNFCDAGYLQNDGNSWYLSDTVDRPMDIFVGITVLVWTKAKSVNSILKQAESERFFMPVFSLDELLQCRRFVFPDVPSTDVESALDYVGEVWLEQSLT